MIKTDLVLGCITLFLNSSILNNLDNYEPVYIQESTVYFKNLSGPDNKTRAVEVNSIFNESFFPKCCPPDFLYDHEDRKCVNLRNTLSIEAELNVDYSVLKSGLEKCPVILDRFVKKKDLNRVEGNGSLVIENVTYSIGQYCIDKVNENEDYFVVRLCREEEYCSDGNQKTIGNDWCIHKCCLDGYGMEGQECKITLRNGLRVKNNTQFYERTDGYALLHGDLTCAETNPYPFATKEFIIMPNATLFMIDEDKYYEPNEYCVETNYDVSSGYVFDIVFTCKLYDKTLIWAMTKMSVIVSSVCFFLLLLIYVFVHKLRTLVEKLIGCYSIVGFIFWTMYAMRLYLQVFGMYCNTFGYVYFFVWMSRLSWLNVLSYEIWRTIGTTRAKIGETNQSLRLKMIYYGLYGITVPVFFTSIFIMSHQQVYRLPKKLIPLIDTVGCFIDLQKIDGNCGYLHFYIPIVISFIINVIFFVKTVIHFVKIKRELKRITKASAHTNRTMNRSANGKGIIILKLGLIMGLTCAFYLYAYLFATANAPILENIRHVWSFTNYFEGLYVLIIFSFNKKTFKSILSRLNVRKKNTSLMSSRERSSKTSTATNEVVMTSLDVNDEDKY